jgi:P4 family phage/plasmid primase-like protien
MQTEKFFSEVMDGDDIQTAWQIMGLCCTCDNSFQKAIILQGAGGSGKSTLLNLITALVGRENISNLSLQQIEEKFATIQLLGKLCNICGDLESTPMKSTATFKKITGGDALTDSFKGKNLVSFVPFARLIFSANTIPLNLEEKSNAFFRRLIIIKCPHVFENPDVGMDAKLRSEMPYIINKSMDALRGLYADGHIHESETSKAAVAELYEDSDTVKAFFNHHIVSCKGAGIRTTDLYDGYKDFCKDAEREYLSKNGFYRNIRDKGIAKKTVHGYEQFADIEWKSKIENPPNADNLGGNSDGFSAACDDEINIFMPWDDSGGN